MEKILYSIHAVGAALIQTPELALDEREAKQLADAIAGVTDQYVMTLDPKKAAWVDLARVCGVVYGPRGVAIWMRKKAEAKANPQRAQQPRPQSAQPATHQARPVAPVAPVHDPNPINPPDLKPNGAAHPSQEPVKTPPGFDPTNIKLIN